MKLTIYYEDGRIANEIKDQTHIATNLLAILFDKYIVKTKETKRIHYKYNYNDLQTITFTLSNGIKYEFKDIPTKQGWLDGCKIEYILKEVKTNEND